MIEKHDRAAIEILVVRVGAPDRTGICYPAERLVVDMLPLETVTTTHLEAVYVHSYPSGTIHRLR